VALGSTQSLRQKSIMDFPWGEGGGGRAKGGLCLGLTTLPSSCADCLEILGALTFCNPMDLSRSAQEQLMFKVRLFYCLFLCPEIRESRFVFLLMFGIESLFVTW
jgi:hypothetical protein